MVFIKISSFRSIFYPLEKYADTGISFCHAKKTTSILVKIQKYKRLSFICKEIPVSQNLNISMFNEFSLPCKSWCLFAS